MIDFASAGSVAVSGIVSVFLALGILQITVGITGKVISQLEKKKKETAKS